MKVDLSRDSFDAAKHFSRVLTQQGRVTLDADANEQAEILLHYLRTLARDLIGPYAAPVENSGFRPELQKDGVRLSPGRYYLDGILVENEQSCPYQTQPDYPLPADDAFLQDIKENRGQHFGFYLDVWERAITSIEDGAIREKALGGPDTCARTKVVWQVKSMPVEVNADGHFDGDCRQMLAQLQPATPPRLAAQVDPGHEKESPCTLPPEAKYRGTENHLYRVEIHQGGKAGSATFKWSRDNGSVATAWLGTSGNDLQVARVRGFTAGCWVELSDDTLELQGKAGVLVKLAKVEGGVLTVDPATVPSADALAWSTQRPNPKVRRWDQARTQQDGTVAVKEGATTWIDLEDGIQIRFEPGGDYRTGDYWLVPARVAVDSGGLEWPVLGGSPEALPARGIVHHYAPLGVVCWQQQSVQLDCYCQFYPLSTCFSYDGPMPSYRRAERPATLAARGAETAPAKAEAAPAKVEKAEGVVAEKGPAKTGGKTTKK